VPLKGFVNVFAASGTLAWDVGKVGFIDELTIKAIGGYQFGQNWRVSDYDASAMAGISGWELGKKTRQMSAELQILGKAFNEKLNFVFGAYADRERTPGAGQRASMIYPVLEPGRILSNVLTTKLQNKSRALYTQMTYDFNDIVSITGGVRYTDDTKGFLARKCAVRAVALTTCVAPYTTNGVFITRSKTWTPMGSLQLNAPEAWTNNGVLDKAMAYFTYSKGFKSGNYNAFGDSAAGTLTSYKPEWVDNYEVGVKFSMFDRRLIGAISRYDMRYTNIQFNVQNVSPITQGPVTSVFNAGAATIQGIEVELQALLFDSLRLGFNGDFAQPRYTRFDDLSAPGGTRVNEPLAFIPDYRVSGSIENRFSLGGEMALTPRVQVTRTGERYLFTDILTVRREAGRAAPVTLTDASLKFDLNDKISFDIYGKNIFNKKYLNDALSFGFVVIQWYAQPTTYGANVRVKF
jgi:iron complex outermembrane receptor protein